MLRFIERNFFLIVQKIGLLFAIIAFSAVVVLGMVSYEKINTKLSDKIDTPDIKFAKYQNPISLEADKISQDLSKNIVIKNTEKDEFDRKFNQSVQKIISNLNQLPDELINKSGMQQEMRVKIRIKADPYNQELQLAYVESLAKLTKQLVNVGGDQVNVADFLRWHDQEFAKQVNEQTQGNILKMSGLKTEKLTGFITLGMAGAALGIFIMFVMMLVMLRIEQNTRK